ncbi:hypothetical protein BJ085DRAFT_21339, partial [Dimargaris cristalligena]
LSEAKIRTLLDNKEFKYLLDFDQLNIQKMNLKAFTGFQERPIRFAPTYKFEIGTHEYDPKRIPAWCDRILWWTPYGSDFINPTNYQSHMELALSDHKPVSSLFRLRIKTIRRDEQAAIYSQLLRELDKFENDCLPTARISDTQLDFGPVEYEKSVSRSVTLTNTGRVPAQFRFIPKLDDTEFCRPWLYVNPPTGTVLPGCQITIHFDIVVTNISAPTLNTSQEELRDILILHLENGKDYFISIQGNYLPTCFGTSLDVLARLPKPIRRMTLEEVQALGEEAQYSVPKEIWRLIDFLDRYGLSVPNLFFIDGKQSLVNYIRNCLDTGDEFDMALLLPPAGKPSEDQEEATARPGNGAEEDEDDDRFSGIYSVADTLVRLLKYLPEPIIPFGYFERCVEAGGRNAIVFQVLDSLPRANLNVFVFLVSFIKEVTLHAMDTEIAKEKLSLLMATILLRPSKATIETEDFTGTIMQHRRCFIRQFL